MLLQFAVHARRLCNFGTCANPFRNGEAEARTWSGLDGKSKEFARSPVIKAPLIATEAGRPSTCPDNKD